jgi:polysaccharide deacetylase family protein (PEP-CTERM system associated)
MYNFLSIDVEDYFMVSAFSDRIKFEDWHNYESRVEKNTYRLLELLGKYGVKATFFVLGWVGKNCPQMVRDIHHSGHEVACHSYNHRLIYNMSPEEFRDDIRRAKGILEEVTGEPVIGFRAPSYSIVRKTLWALDILIDEGFLYDSSIFPIHHDRYGFPESERFPHFIERENGSILEMPPSTYRIFGINLPIAGGGYMRLSPAWILKAAVRSVNAKEKQPFILYLHPWEIDIEQPRLNGRWLSMVRHYLNLSSTMPKLEMFLEGFRFEPLSRLLSAYNVTRNS